MPLSTPPLGNGIRLRNIVPLGYLPILDFTVEGTHCYESGGVIHHNCGKTLAGAYEMTLHLTGLYPKWWEGRRFDYGIKAVAASDTSKTTRDVIQNEVLGPIHQIGTGMIPGDLIRKTTAKAGVADAIDTCYVKHVSGKTSSLTFKSYDQRRESFQGLALDAVWLDEETEDEIFDEALMRTMTTGGVLWLTFTPLQGITPLVQRFLPDGKIPQ